MKSSLKSKVFSGVIWMAGISACQQIMAFFVQIILARLLVPHDYGVAALVMTIGSFAVVFSTVGIGTAIVQKKNLSPATIDAVAIITAGIAVLLGGILFLTSNVIGRYYGLDEMPFLLKLVALDIFLKVLISLYSSLMLRELQYRALSCRTFVGLIAQSVVSIVLALHGYGAKSLVIGYVLGSAMQLGLCMATTRYVPRTLGDYNGVKSIFQFGGWILLGRMSNQAAHVLDQMVITKFLNVSSLGLVNVSKRLTSIIPNTFLGFAGSVALPVFSKWQDDVGRIEAAYWLGLRINMLVVFPLCALTGLFSYQILALLYGAKWLMGDVLMKILSLQVALISIDSGYCASVINATGNPRYGTIVMIASLLLIPGFIYIGSFWGLIGIGWGMVAYSAMFVLINQLVLRSLLHFHVLQLPISIIRATMPIIPMIVAGCGLQSLNVVPRFDIVPAFLSIEWFSLAVRLAVCGIVCLGVYVVTARLTSSDDFLFLWNGIRRRK